MDQLCLKNAGFTRSDMQADMFVCWLGSDALMNGLLVFLNVDESLFQG